MSLLKTNACKTNLISSFEKLDKENPMDISEKHLAKSPMLPLWIKWLNGS